MVLTPVLVLMDPSTELTELCPEPEAGSGEISLEASKQCLPCPHPLGSWALTD